jgi:hypothetical protein
VEIQRSNNGPLATSRKPVMAGKAKKHLNEPETAEMTTDNGQRTTDQFDN